jgi:hypothetical protein
MIFYNQSSDTKSCDNRALKLVPVSPCLVKGDLIPMAEDWKPFLPTLVDRILRST